MGPPIPAVSGHVTDPMEAPSTAGGSTPRHRIAGIVGFGVLLVALFAGWLLVARPGNGSTGGQLRPGIGIDDFNRADGSSLEVREERAGLERDRGHVDRARRYRQRRAHGNGSEPRHR